MRQIFLRYARTDILYQMNCGFLSFFKIKRDLSFFQSEAYRVEYKVLQYAHQFFPVPVYYNRRIAFQIKFQRHFVASGDSRHVYERIRKRKKQFFFWHKGRSLSDCCDGILAGCVLGNPGIQVDIENIVMFGSITTTRINGTKNVGGMIGYAGRAKATSCHAVAYFLTERCAI